MVWIRFWHIGETPRAYGVCRHSGEQLNQEPRRKNQYGRF